MNYRNFQIYFYLLFLTGSVALTFVLFWPYLTLLAFGGVLAIISHPVYRFLLKIFRIESVAALLTVLLMLTIVILPLTYFLIALSGELVSLIPSLKSLVGTISLTNFLRERLPVSLQAQVPVLANELLQLARTVAQSVSDNIFSIFSNLLAVLFGFFVVIISAYYLLKDGGRLRKTLLEISPLGNEYDQLVVERLITAVRAVMGGVLIIAIIKGLIGGVLFYFFSIPTPIFWGALTGVSTFIPIIGKSIVTIPLLLYLLVQGQYVTAIIFAVIAITTISMVDNVLQPKLVQSKTNIHPLLILLSVVGGLQLYGFAGFILGPLTLAVTMALLDIYKKEIKKIMKIV